MSKTSTVSAEPGYFLLQESTGDDGKAQYLLAMPIVAWGCSVRTAPSRFGLLWGEAEPICFDGGYELSVGILTPNGLVVQLGNQCWATVEDFLDERYGARLQIHGLKP